MMMAAMMGAVAFQKGLGAVHSLAHPLSAECGMHHGTANAILLPVVLEFNRSAVPDRIQYLASLFGGGDTARGGVRGAQPQDFYCPAVARLGCFRIHAPMLADKAIQTAAISSIRGHAPAKDLFAL